MLRKVWEALGLLIVLVIAVNLIIASLKPFLPILGLVVIAIIGGALVKLLFFRQKFW